MLIELIHVKNDNNTLIQYKYNIILYNKNNIYSNVIFHILQCNDASFNFAVLCIIIVILIIIFTVEPV